MAPTIIARHGIKIIKKRSDQFEDVLSVFDDFLDEVGEEELDEVEVDKGEEEELSGVEGGEFEELEEGTVGEEGVDEGGVLDDVEGELPFPEFVAWQLLIACCVLILSSVILPPVSSKVKYCFWIQLTTVLLGQVADASGCTDAEIQG